MEPDSAKRECNTNQHNCMEHIDAVTVLGQETPELCLPVEPGLCAVHADK
jgi:hypothetical protein